MKKSTSFNVRIIDNHDGTYQIDWVSRFRPNEKGEGGSWVDSTENRIATLLRNSEYKK